MSAPLRSAFPAALLASLLVLAVPPGAWGQLEVQSLTPQDQAGHRPAPSRGPVCTSQFLNDCSTPNAVRRSDDGPAQPPIASIATLRSASGRTGLQSGRPATAAPAGPATEAGTGPPAAPPSPPPPPPPDPVVENLDAVRTAITRLGLQGAMAVDRSTAGNDLVLSFPVAPAAASRQR